MSTLCIPPTMEHVEACNFGYQLNKCQPSAYPPTMSNVEAFQAFLQSRQTGLTQRSPEWVKARQNTIGASEISALTGSSPFDNQSSLVRKKTRPVDMSQNVACAWGFLFEPFARAYLEWEHNTKIFGHTTSLNLAKDHPLYGKVTCSPDGYFEARDKTIVLLEFKCPYKRKIVVNKIPCNTAIRYKPVSLLAEECNQRPVC